MTATFSCPSATAVCLINMSSHCRSRRKYLLQTKLKGLVKDQFFGGRVRILGDFKVVVGFGRHFPSARRSLDKTLLNQKRS